MATTMISKDQVAVPKNVREFLGVGPGSAIEFELKPNGEVVIRAATTRRRAPRSQSARLRGCATVKLSADEMLALTRGTWLSVILGFPTLELIAPR
jgi:AbrB family looped-hinge helix DNA binding protein